MENNQSVKADAGKPKLSLVPSQIIYEIAKVREYGNNKYPEGGKDNWKEVEIERYIDAAYRHFLAVVEDPLSKDEESGLHHLSHLACNIAFLCEKLLGKSSLITLRKWNPLPSEIIDKINKGEVEA